MNVSRRRATFATLTGSTGNILILSIQAFVLVPLYLSAIGPRLYGAWLGSGDILVWMQVFDLGLPNLMIQRIGAAHGRGDTKAVAEYFATGLLVLAFVALVVVLIILLVSFSLPGWMGLVNDEGRILQSCFIAGAIVSGFSLFLNGVVGFTRGVQNTTFMNITGIVSSLVGFCVSLGFILAGWGLWAIPIGMGARTGISFVGGGIFTARMLRGEMSRFFRVRASLLREFFIISPAATLGSISYAAMNQSETILVAIFIRPELAVIFSLTRKALEIARGLVDMIAFGTYGGFAHLVASNDRHRTLQVHAEINSLQLSLAVVLVSAYMAVNESLLSIWVGSAQYGGALLTILMATQFVLVTGSFLMNYLYRATGSIMRGSMALFAESAIRFPGMIILLLWIGLPGIPIAGMVTSAIFWLLIRRWTLKEVSLFSQPSPVCGPQVWAGRAFIFVIGVLLCIFIRWESWSYVLITSSVMAFVGGVVLIFVDPLLTNTHVVVASILSRLRIMVLRWRN